MVLYKYRSLQTFEHFVDILVNQCLYAAPFLSLSDPMEGRYVRLGSKSRTAMRRLRSDDDLRIVSLSSVWNSTLMWSHYADGHKGAVIAVELDQPNIEAMPVRYVSRLSGPRTADPIERIRALLLQKHEFWRYEKEYRIIVKNKDYVRVNIVEITLGLAVEANMHDLVIDLARTVDPSLPVTRILKSGLDVI